MYIYIYYGIYTGVIAIVIPHVASGRDSQYPCKQCIRLLYAALK